MSLKSNQRAAGYPHNSRATNAHLGASCLAHCLVESLDGFSPPAANLEPSRTMESSQQGGISQLSSSLISLYHATKVYCIFSSGVLLTNPGRKSKGIARGYVAWRASVVSLTNNSLSGDVPPSTGFFQPSSSFLFKLCFRK